MTAWLRIQHVAAFGLQGQVDLVLGLGEPLIVDGGGGGSVDRALVERARDGDRDAFNQLVPETVERLVGVAYRILHDAALAEDATQQALFDAWRHLPQLRDAGRFEGWTYRLVVRACYAEARRRRPWLGLFSIRPGEEPRQADTSEALAGRDQLSRAFRRLSTQHRAVIVLHHHVGLPLTEIAKILEIPVGTARSRLHYGLRAMRDALTADDLPASTGGMP
jgi:RNA polymerase sigma-70 factor, ECF subfamily